MKFLNIEFAPLCIPLERRLQTLSLMICQVVHLTNVFIAAGITYYLLFHTRLWWLCSLYLVWIFFIDTDNVNNSKRRSEWVRDWSIWKYSTAYFPIKLVKASSEELSPKKNYLFSCFPHGLIGTGVAYAFTTNAVNIRKHYPHHSTFGHTLTLIFYLPFLRHIAHWLGSLPSSLEALNFTMGKPDGGNISCLVVGGAEEAYYLGKHKIVLKTRKGFIKVALRNGCNLVPVYSFGENEIYGQYRFEEGSFPKKIQNIFKKITGIAPILVKGRGIFQYSFGLLPYRRQITIVVGEPIEVQKIEKPTQEQIDQLHQLFQTKLVELFDSQKKYYLKDHETAQLEIC